MIGDKVSRRRHPTMQRFLQIILNDFVDLLDVVDAFFQQLPKCDIAFGCFQDLILIKHSVMILVTFLE
jgi:hypothetical protein